LIPVQVTNKYTKRKGRGRGEGTLIDLTYTYRHSWTLTDHQTLWKRGMKRNGKAVRQKEGQEMTYITVLKSLSMQTRDMASACSGITRELGRIRGSVLSGWCGRCGFNAELFKSKINNKNEYKNNK
jgi:hypothetical protein